MKHATNKTYTVICLETGFDLTKGKKYRAISDRALEAKGRIRVIDDSGEDYVYLARRFTRKLHSAIATST